MTRVRMVASDLDGTLVRPDGTISARTVATLQACQDAGLELVFVTGRPPRWMRPIADATGHVGVAVCANGAVIYHLGDERVMDVRAMPAGEVALVAAALTAALPGASFALEMPHGYRREPGFPAARDAGDPGVDDVPLRVAPLQALLADDPVVTKVLCRLPAGADDDADAMLRVARRVLAGIAEPVHSDARGGLLEVAAAGVSKATTLALLAEQRGIDPAEVVAFGDMPNDIAMLHWAGVGYAVADGHPEALAAADALAPPVLEDGVAQVLEAILKTGRRLPVSR